MSMYHFADMNGDRQDDVVLTPPDGRFLVSHGGVTGWERYGGDSSPKGNVKIGDLDGDGKGDIFWASSSDGTWRMSSGGKAGWKVLRTGVTGVTTQQLQLADFDGDGKDDVFHARSDGLWRVSYGGTGAWVTLATMAEAGSQVRVR